MSLIIARIFETIYLKPQPNYLPIISKGKEINSEFIQSFDEFTKNWFQELYRKNERLTRLSTKIDTVISSTKKGPNGPALVMAHYDSKPVYEDTKLFNAISNINTLCGNEWITKMIKCHYKPELTRPNLTHSRINYVAEGGGKTRIFAIGDYWSQMSLKGIHNYLMEVLRSLKTDATHDQNKGFKRVLDKSNGKQAYSYDLSGASDRIPLTLQKIVLKHAFPNDISESWSTVIADRKFQTPEGKQISWEVGQPLGLLSSWPSFALWHHIFVQYCAFRCGIGTFREYQILGDDVVIWNKAVGDIYSALISEIGIPINEAKSVKSCNGNTQIEFAKRIALNGVELSGLNYNITNKSELTFVNPLLEEMFNRGLITHTPDHFGIEYFKSSRRNILLSKIVSARYRLLPFTEEGNNTAHITALLLYAVRQIRKQLIQDKLAKLDSILMANKPLEVYYNKAGCQIDQIQLGNKGFSNPESLHPLVWAINAQGEELAIALSLLEFEDDPSVSPIEYLPIVGNELYFKNRKVRQSQWFTSTLIKAYDSIYNRTLIDDSNL